MKKTGIPYVDMYMDGNWKWIVPVQVALFLFFILFFELEM